MYAVGTDVTTCPYGPVFQTATEPGDGVSFTTTPVSPATAPSHWLAFPRSRNSEALTPPEASRHAT
jgi:hypothetical protein